MPLAKIGSFWDYPGMGNVCILHAKQFNKQHCQYDRKNNTFSALDPWNLGSVKSNEGQRRYDPWRGYLHNCNELVFCSQSLHRRNVEMLTVVIMNLLLSVGSFPFSGQKLTWTFKGTGFLQKKNSCRNSVQSGWVVASLSLCVCISMHDTSLTCASYAAAFLGKKSSLQLQHQIIHSPPLHLGGATGSWWSSSAKHPNWRRQCAAGGNQLGQMPPPPCHVFWAGQRRV